MYSFVFLREFLKLPDNFLGIVLLSSYGVGMLLSTYGVGMLLSRWSLFGLLIVLNLGELPLLCLGELPRL